MSKTAQIKSARHMGVGEAAAREDAVEGAHGRIGIAGIEGLGRTIKRAIGVGCGLGALGWRLGGRALSVGAIDPPDGA